MYFSTKIFFTKICLYIFFDQILFDPTFFILYWSKLFFAALQVLAIAPRIAGGILNLLNRAERGNSYLIVWSHILQH